MSTMSFHAEVGEMATESFYEDMVIDTPEAEANLTKLVESGVCWKRGNARFRDGDVNGELAQRLIEKYGRHR